MQETTELEALLARVEAATGPNRELDCRIDAALIHQNHFVEVGPPTYDPPRYFCNPNPKINWIGYDLLNTSPRYTSSIDAAVALCERVLPHMPFISMERYSDGWYSKISKHSTVAGYSGKQKPSASLAILAAILRAKIAEMKGTNA